MVRVALELVPIPVDMLGSDTHQGTAGYAKDSVLERHSFFIAREWFVEQGSGGKTWACSLCRFRLGL